MNYKKGPYKLILSESDGTVVETWTIPSDVYIPSDETIDGSIHENEIRERSSK